MHRKLAAVMMVLCCGALAVGGCAKKEMVKGEESNLSAAPLPQSTTPTETTPAPPAQPLTEQAVKQEPIAEAPAVKEQPVSSQAIEAALKTVYFDFDSFTLSPAARDTLAGDARYLVKNPAVKVQIEGHCDERGSDEYNLALGEKRATTVMNYLETLGVPAARMTTISYGKEKPAVEGHDEAAWAKNRRAAFVAQ